MLRQYKNSLLKFIEQRQLDPNLFQAEESDDGMMFTIQLKDSPFRFDTVNDPEDFHSFACSYTEYKPNFPVSEWIPHEGFTTSEGLYVFFEHWLDSHVAFYRLEQTEPDLWERIIIQEQHVNGAALLAADMDFFSNEEKVYIRSLIDGLSKEIVKALQPTTDELKTINTRLEYLSDSVDRLNKFDWRGVAISTVAAIVLALALDAEKGLLLFNLFKQVFSEVIVLLP